MSNAAGRPAKPVQAIVIAGAVLAILLGVFLTDLTALLRAVIAVVVFLFFYIVAVVIARRRN